MNKAKKYLSHVLPIMVLLAMSSQVFSYVRSQSKNGVGIFWNAKNMDIDIFVNSQNSSGLSDSIVQSVAANSISEWNGASLIHLTKKETVNKNQKYVNELYFSSDSSLFNGSGVVGVTQVDFVQETGEIIEADILIKDSFFSTDPLAVSYLGNVVTHEVGHLLGLAHSQVFGSTMFYAVSRGQYKLSADDRAGAFTIYPSGDSSKGSLSGTIVGGKNLFHVFGAHVQAISIKTGKVMGASISDIVGKFTIAGLPLDDQYIIYTGPVKVIGLPSSYANAHSDFCESSKKYRGSFFQSCGAHAEGFPQAVALNSSFIDVGNITIRCGLDTPPEYIQKKGAVAPLVADQFNVNAYTKAGLGGAFVGFFSSAEMQNGTARDYFKVDFSNVDWNTISTSASLYLELKVINQVFYSPFKAKLNILVAGVGHDVTPKYIQESDGLLNIDTVQRIMINREVPSDNEFEIRIAPEKIETFLLDPEIQFSKNDLFPAFADFQDDLYFYLVIATVVKRNGDGSYTQVAYKKDYLSDNTKCSDAVNTYSLNSYSTTGTNAILKKDKTAACGTVDMDQDHTGGGPGSFILGLLLSSIIFYALSRYSKMA